jgi:hypothetical protein
MHLASCFSPFHMISNINIWCGQQNHERSTMETGRASSITNLDIADGIVACKFNKPCEVEIIKLGLRSTTSQLYSEIRSRK